MGIEKSDPRLSLYDTAQQVFDRLAAESGRDDVIYLAVYEDHRSRHPFVDMQAPTTYEADEFEIASLDIMSPGCVAIGINLYRQNQPYARPLDTFVKNRRFLSHSKSNHVVVTSQSDGPPTLAHIDYFGSHNNTVGDMQPLLAANYAEVLSFNRAAYIRRALGELSIDHLAEF